MNLCTHLALVGLLATARAPANDSIRVYDVSFGCGRRLPAGPEADPRTDEPIYEWKRVDGGFALGERVVSDAMVAALRAQILAAPERAPDLLQQIGVTPEALRAHRADILETAWPELLRPPQGQALELPSALEPNLAIEAVGALALRHLTGPNVSTTRYELRIEIPGDPPIAIESKSIVAWKLPWTIEVAGEVRQSSDTRLSLALAELVRPNGPNASVIDGRRYWRDEFWRDELVWEWTLGRELDRHLISWLSAQLAGHEDAMRRFHVDHSMSGNVNGQDAALFFELSAKEPSLIDTARWWSPLAEGKPTATWTDFSNGYELARACVEEHAWLLDWKRSSPSNRLEANVVGSAAFSEERVDLFVLPAWMHAGLSSEPLVEVKLRRGKDWCGTVWLAPAIDEALVTNAQAGPALHWFDGLDVSFHPKKPTYALVRAGKATVQTIR